MNTDYRSEPRYIITSPFHTRINFSLRKSDKWWSTSPKISLDTSFNFWFNGNTIIHVERSADSGIYYDGFSIPLIIKILSLTMLRNIMHGIESSFVHDKVCEDQTFTREQRVEIFNQAYDAAIFQYYDDDPDAWGSKIKRSVKIGSRYFKRC